MTEAEINAELLVRAGLEHASEVGASISGLKAFLPHTVGRTAVELLVRAIHLLDTDASAEERAMRRIDEWLYALMESGYRRLGVVAAGHPGAEELEDESAMLERIRERAAELGLEVVSESGRMVGRHRVSPEGRVSTMRLAEAYLTNDGAEGMPSFLLRNHAAVAHGVETGLLASSIDEIHDAVGVNVPRPKIMDPPVLAFSLMQVPLASVNALSSLSRRFGWEFAGPAWNAYAKARDRMLEIWWEASNQELDDVAPDRPRTVGPFGPLSTSH